MSDALDPTAAAQGQAERATSALFARDRASQALGMRITGVRPGWARVAMSVRADMVNGHGVCHGGIVFALGDSAFAFACNSYNDSTVGAAATIDFLGAAREGDELIAEATELWRTRRNGLYEIVVSNQRGERIALFRGRSYRIDGQVVGGA
jgi:acyl-CoA thioesterase